ncbi:ATP-dependent RNA helicase DBP8, putative [Plasmodium malariae]|uniref:ATP-dependent RNA helicase DBP8, putative n=1 Tax=Plasmodium malariae TaxID=5858 RepID=A0A1C3L0N6_PLAMA|nr:ATP-dependent RNA helicase DBP8, putative [Plasmodium malariae]
MKVCYSMRKGTLSRISKLWKLFYIRKYLNKKYKERERRKKKEESYERNKGEKSVKSKWNEEKGSASIRGDNMVTFKSLGVEEWLIKISKSVHIVHPTKIQRLCLPLIIEGKNVIGSSETGTGKTICYCWSILQELNKNFFAIFALILVPTRELVFQIVEQFHLYGTKIGVKVLSCIGGFSLIEQRSILLSKPHIVVGTPGRVSDLLYNCEDIIKCFKRLRYIVLDEADLLLQKCFESKLKIILDSIPKSSNNSERKTLFFSSTITDALHYIKEGFPNDNLLLVNANKKQKPVKNLDQRYIYIDDIAQITYLVYILKNKLIDQSGIIFTANSYKCELIYTVLNMLNHFSVECLHSSKEQKKRMSSLSKFKNGMCKILVATDIISRGIDIPKISFVINFDFPNDTVKYIHRVGRTARADRKGLAISFIDKKGEKKKDRTEKFVKKNIAIY